MARQKKEIKVEFPDCDICGRDIGTEVHLLLEIQLSKKHETGVGNEYLGFSQLFVCELCIPHPELWKPKLLELIDRTKNSKQL